MSLAPSRLLHIALVGFVSVPSLAGGSPHDPVQTRKALTALMEVANEPIPKESPCMGHYGTHEPPRIKDLLSMPLAYLDTGENRITGTVEDLGQGEQLCTLLITHAKGEDVASTQIRFKLHRGKALVGTLTCLMTP